jgi:hypothetical protein
MRTVDSEGLVMRLGPQQIGIPFTRLRVTEVHGLAPRDGQG